MKPAKWIKRIPATMMLLVFFGCGAICLVIFFRVWLNSNQGAVTAGLTFAYVLTTIGILWQTAKIHEEESRPFVIFDLVSENRLVKSVRSNIGARPAYDVRVMVTPKIITPNTGFRHAVSYENEPISLLAPGRAIKDFLTSNQAFLRANPALSFRVDISYRDSSHKKYDETATLSLEYLKNFDIGGEDDPLR
jgi:hypothetical protein